MRKWEYEDILLEDQRDGWKVLFRPAMATEVNSHLPVAELHEVLSGLVYKALYSVHDKGSTSVHARRHTVDGIEL